MTQTRTARDFEPISVSFQQGVGLLTPIGDLDMRVSELLREALSQAKGTSPTKAIVDMSNVPFVDSAVLGIFVEYTRYFHNGGGSLYLAALNPFVKRSLQVTSLNKVFNVTESVDEAMTKTVG